MIDCTNFIHYNPNPEFKSPKYHWKRGDCTIRAVCKATGLSWETAFIEMCKGALEVHDMPNCKIGEAAGLKRLGFVEGESLKPAKGEKWPFVADMARKYKDKTILCNCVGHIVCCKGGQFYDVWNCGGIKVRSFWIYTK